MARNIDPNVVKQLRLEKGWTMEELATRAKIHKQTINRIEHGKQKDSRAATIANLCSAFGVDEAVITGLAPRQPAEATQDDVLSITKYQLNGRICGSARNAFSLVAARYNVLPTQIIEMAPFLFYLAAERSLSRRQAKLDDIENAIQKVADHRDGLPKRPLARSAVRSL